MKIPQMKYLDHLVERDIDEPPVKPWCIVVAATR